MWCCAPAPVIAEVVPKDNFKQPVTAYPTAAEEAVVRMADMPKVPGGPRLVKVLISGARALRNTDRSAFTSGGASDPYVLCEVPGKASSKVQTPVVNDAHNPNWEFEGVVKDFIEGDSLYFSVWDKDTLSSESLGNITFPYDSFKQGFSGEVLLENNKDAKSYLKVSISAADGKYPAAPAPTTEFTIAVDATPLGLDFDMLDDKFARIVKILDGGKVQAYNKTAPPELQVREKDFICSCNGVFGKPISALLKAGGKLELSIRRSEEVDVTFAPKGGSLGMDLTYESERQITNDILIRRLAPGGGAAESGKIFPGDRIIGAAGVPVGSKATALTEYLQKARTQGKAELKLLRVKPCPSSGPVDVSAITRMAKDDIGLLPQPAAPKFKTALVQIYVRTQPFGGSDKSSNGHRYDSTSIANGMIEAGMSCQLIHYVYEEHDKFLAVCKQFKALVVRCNPGQIKADGGDQTKFDNSMREMRKLGIQVWPSPDVMEFMGAKDALCKVAKLNIGLEDTLAYYTEKEFSDGFKKTMKFQPRVVKQNRGSAGEGIWIIKLKRGDYCSRYGEKSCTDDELLVLMEANDNHAEEHTVAEFVEFCVNGRTAKSGTWTSKGAGKYLEGGKAAGGQLVDQRFCPRIVEGELRYNMVCDALVGIIHKKPAEGGISAVAGTGSIYTFYGPEEAKFSSLTTNFLKRDLDKIMPSLGLASEPIPLWWTTDFINASPPGTPLHEEKWIVGEFNCSCVGISKCLPAYCREGYEKANFNDIPPADRTEARDLGALMGQKALKILSTAR